MSESCSVVRTLQAYSGELSPVMLQSLDRCNTVALDLSAGNSQLAAVDLGDAESFSAYVDGQLRTNGASVGIGRYDEDRVIYRHSSLFDGDSEPRSVHLGVDLFAPAGTPVLAPLPGTVHSTANNAGLGDYGPTVILEHRLEGVCFFTLYGHLGIDSLAGLKDGQQVAAGSRIGALGTATENGGWPPHLHLQLITDMLGRRGDFPGVAAPSERERYLVLCPDPNLILRLGGL